MRREALAAWCAGMKYHIVGRPNHLVGALFDTLSMKEGGIAKSDILVFTGGSDVWPELYKQKVHPLTNFDKDRDEYEQTIYRFGKNKWKIGICRGGQFLNVMNGGKMWQHVDNHGVDHFVQYRDRRNVMTSFFVTSTHHQMMVPNIKDGAEVWAVATRSSIREHQTRSGVKMPNHHWTDPEVVYYPKSWSLCFQPHPEHAGATETRNLFYTSLARVFAEQST